MPKFKSVDKTTGKKKKEVIAVVVTEELKEDLSILSDICQRTLSNYCKIELEKICNIEENRLIINKHKQIKDK